MEFREQVPLAPFTTLGLGGPARRFVECASEEDIREALRRAAARAWPVTVFAGGSNVVFPDGGVGGLVLRVAGSGVSFEESGNTVTARAWAGGSWDGFVEECVRRGLGGVECLSGIPGSVGATPVQNVGAYGQEVAETVVAVRAIDRRTLATTNFSAEECRFGYRQSRFKAEDRDRFVITLVTFRLAKNAVPAVRYTELQRALDSASGHGSTPGGRPGLEAVRREVLTLRRGKSMLVDPSDPDSRSAGSFFMNPVLSQEQFEAVRSRWRDLAGAGDVPSFPAPEGVKVPAGWLVERAGFAKGTRMGNVGVSSKHALALVNHGGTTAELLALAGEIRRGVQKTFGVLLEPEPVIL